MRDVRSTLALLRIRQPCSHRVGPARHRLPEGPRGEVQHHQNGQRPSGSYSACCRAFLRGCLCGQACPFSSTPQLLHFLGFGGGLGGGVSADAAASLLPFFFAFFFDCICKQAAVPCLCNACSAASPPT